MGRHEPAARHAAQALTRDRNLAEDAVGETFEAVHSALVQGAGPDVHFRAYLLSSVRNTVARRLRQASRAVPTSHLPEIGYFDDVDSLAGGDESDLAKDAYDSLPERYQAVLWHAEIEGEPLSEVARVVGTTPGAAGQLLVRARRQLRQAYVQAHVARLNRTDLPAACRTARASMGGHALGALSQREKARLDEHLLGCDDCRVILALADVVGAKLPMSIVAAVLGGVGAERYLRSGHTTPMTSLISRRISALRQLAPQAAIHPGAVAATIAASVGVVVIAASTLSASSRSSEHPFVTTPASVTTTRLPKSISGFPPAGPTVVPAASTTLPGPPPDQVTNTPPTSISSPLTSPPVSAPPPSRRTPSPRIPSLPSLLSPSPRIPSLPIPTVPARLPVPSLSIPKVSIPSLTSPTLPTLTLPTVTLPATTLPSATLPGALPVGGEKLP